METYWTTGNFVLPSAILCVATCRTTGVSVGGLGLRTAVTVALPAFVASRILSRPIVVTMVDHLCAAIGASRQTIMAEYDARTDEALSRLASTLPTATALELLAKLDEAHTESHLSWQNVLSGSEPAMRDQPSPAPRHARGITPDDGDGDEEHPHTHKRTKIQGVITAYIDSGVREGLLQMHEGEGSWAARTRLAELGDPNVDHTWLWRLNPRHGSTLDADEFVDSVRFRLGCAGPTGTRHLRRLQLWYSGHGRGACLLLRPGRGHAWSQRRLLSHTRSRTTMRPHLRDGGTWPHPWHGLEAC